MTELSIGVTGPEYDWKETEIPLFVPTLTEEERRYLQSGGKPTPEIERKARAFAEQRRGAGKSPFAQAGEQQPPTEEPQKRPSFSDWLAQKAGKGPIPGFPGQMATPLAAPPKKFAPWGGLARGPRVPGLPQIPVSPRAMIAGTGAPGEVMPSEQQYKYLPPEEQTAWKKWEEEIIGPGELVPERETLSPSAQRAFKRRQESIEYELKTGKPLLRTIGKTGLMEMPALWKQTEERGIEYMPSIMEKISDKIATGQDLSKIESLGNRALMLGSGIVNGYTAGIFSEALKDQMIPQDVIDEMLYQGGHLAGWMKGWPALGGKIFQGQITKPAIDALSKVIKAAPKTQAWLQYMGGATRLGAMSAASDLNQKPEEIVKAGVEGTALGAVFHGTALLDFFKKPWMNQAARQFGSRALANLIGAYDPKVITALKEDPAQTLPAIVDEIFMSVFSAPGKKPGQMMKEWHTAQTELAKINQEYKTQIKTSPEIARIVRNLAGMQELAFRPGTEKARAAIAQENEGLIQIYRARHAEVGPEGEIVPPGESENRIRMRRRVQEMEKQRATAEAEADRLAEEEKARLGIPPVSAPEGVPVEKAVSVIPPAKVIPSPVVVKPIEEAVFPPVLPVVSEKKPTAMAGGEPRKEIAKYKFAKTQEELQANKDILQDMIDKGTPMKEVLRVANKEMFQPIGMLPESLNTYGDVLQKARDIELANRIARKTPEERRAEDQALARGRDLAKETAKKAYPQVESEVKPGLGITKPAVKPTAPLAKPELEVKEQRVARPTLEPPETRKVREAMIAEEQKIVDQAIESGKVKPEILKPGAEETEKSRFAQALKKHREFKDSKLNKILEIMLPSKKPGEGPGFGLSIKYVKGEGESWFDKETEKEVRGYIDKEKGIDIEFVKRPTGGFQHAGSPVSAEALGRAKVIEFKRYNNRYKKFIPTDQDIDVNAEAGPDEVIFQRNTNPVSPKYNEVTLVSKGDRVPSAIIEGLKTQFSKMPIPKKPTSGGGGGPAGPGLSLQRVIPKSPEDIELDRALVERRIPGSSIRIPPPEKVEPAIDYLLRSEGKSALEKEKHFIPGFTVVDNLRRMGPVGKKIAEAGDNFVYEQNAHTSRDQWLAKGAVRMLAHSMKKGGRLEGISLLKRSEAIGKHLIDLIEDKVQPTNEHETAAKGLVKELFKDIAETSEALGMNITTAFGREVPWASRANYFPQVWKRAGLEKFLDSEETPFKHLRSIYIEHLAKELNPDIFKSDPKEAIRQMEQRWREIRRDMKTKPFANLEMSRILDEEILGKLRAKWATAYPNEKFPLERDTDIHVLMNYLSGARTRLAWIKNFGKDVIVKGSFRPELIDKLVPQMQNEANYKYVMNFFHQYLTRSGFDTRTTRLMRTVRTAQLWKLGTAFIPNSLQWFTNVLPLVSTKAGLQGLMDASKVMAGNKELTEFFMKSGARTMKSAMREAMMEDQTKINGLADLMLKIHLFNGTEYWNALYAAMTGGRQEIGLSKKLAERPEAYRHKAWENELRKLGLTDEDLTQIKAGKPLEKGSEQVFRGMFEMRKNTQFLSDAFHLPKTWSHPLGRVATQFKNFAYNQTRLIITEPLVEAWKFAKTGGREGDITKLMKALVILPAAGALITKAKEETYKVFGLHFYEDLLAGKSAPIKLGIFMANTGGLGIATDIIGALGFGTKGIAQMLGGPTFSDVLGVLEATGNTGKEVWTAIANKNPGWLSHRGTAIKEYWLRVGERLSPDMRIIIQNFFKEWKDAKAATNWSVVYKEATKTYKENYKLKGEYEANQFWEAWMATQGQEYADIFGKTPRKPTAKEIDQWWEEMGKPIKERMKMPGISEEDEEGGTGGTYLW